MCNIYSILNNFYDKNYTSKFLQGFIARPEFSCCGHINDNVFMAVHGLV